MEHLGRFVELPAYAVAAVFPYYAKAVVVGHFGDHGPYIANTPSGAHLPDALPEATVGDVHEFSHFFGDRAHEKHFVGVPMELIEAGRHVDIQDIALLEYLVFSGDAVADHLVQGGADGLGKTLVVEGRGVGPPGEDIVVAQAVNLLGGDTWPDMATNIFEGREGHLGRLPHKFDFPIGLNGYHLGICIARRGPLGQRGGP